jgi:eukaryotic-like serine/threonine-protein kinase
VRGDPITTAGDTCSLGVVLYELLTGRRLYRFKTGSPSEIEQAICEWEPERPSIAAGRSENSSTTEETTTRLARRLRGDLDAIVLMALRMEPQRRYSTGKRLSGDIRRHLEGQPVSASKDTWF